MFLLKKKSSKDKLEQSKGNTVNNSSNGQQSLDSSSSAQVICAPQPSIFGQQALEKPLMKKSSQEQIVHIVESRLLRQSSKDKLDKISKEIEKEKERERELELELEREENEARMQQSQLQELNQPPSPTGAKLEKKSSKDKIEPEKSEKQLKNTKANMDNQESQQPSFDCVFTSDLHGNTGQYQAFFRNIAKYKPRLALLGGDLFPKGSYQGWEQFKNESIPLKSLQFQRQFFIDQLVPEFLRCKEETPQTIFIIIFGNADFAANKATYNAILQETHLDSNILILLNEYTIIKFPDVKIQLTVYGMSYILGSSRKTKDFERFDDVKGLKLAKISKHHGPIYQHPHISNCSKSVTLSGLVSDYKGLQSKFMEDFTDKERNTLGVFFTEPEDSAAKYGGSLKMMNLPPYDDFTENMKYKYSIDYEISKISERFVQHNLKVPSDASVENSELKALNMFISHQPPYGGVNDKVKIGHVGSISLKKWFSKLNIDFSFHGHCHETVNLSQGKYMTFFEHENDVSCDNERCEEELGSEQPEEKEKEKEIPKKKTSPGSSKSSPKTSPNNSTSNLFEKKKKKGTFAFSSGNVPTKIQNRITKVNLLNPEGHQFFIISPKK